MTREKAAVLPVSHLERSLRYHLAAAQIIRETLASKQGEAWIKQAQTERRKWREAHV